MRSYLFSLCTFFIILHCQAQIDDAHYVGIIGIVQDIGGYANLRQTAKNSNNIIDKLPNGSVVFTQDTVGNWIKVYYSPNGNIKEGYVYSDRIKLLSTLEKIPIYHLTSNQVVLKKDSVNIVLNTKEFEVKSHQIGYQKGTKYVETIDKELFFGKDGDLPTREYANITLVRGHTRFNLPIEAFKNLFEPNLDYTSAVYDYKEDSWYLLALNSDGAGGYYIVWQFTNNQYKGRYIFIP